MERRSNLESGANELCLDCFASLAMTALNSIGISLTQLPAHPFELAADIIDDIAGL